MEQSRLAEIERLLHDALPCNYTNAAKELLDEYKSACLMHLQRTKERDTARTHLEHARKALGTAGLFGPESVADEIRRLASQRDEAEAYGKKMKAEVERLTELTNTIERDRTGVMRIVADAADDWRSLWPHGSPKFADAEARLIVAVDALRQYRRR